MRTWLIAALLPLTGCLGGSPVGTCGADDPQEPNDDSASATVLDQGGGISGCIDGSRADLDLFRLDAPDAPASGGYWDLLLTGPVEGDALLLVREPSVDFAVITRTVEAADQGAQLWLGAAPSSQLELTLSANGTDADLGYDLVASWNAVDDQHEPNQTLDTATDITLGQSVTASCNGFVGGVSSTAHDWYRVTGAADGTAVVTVTGAPSDITLQVVVFNEPTGVNVSVGEAPGPGEGFSATIPVSAGVGAFAIEPVQTASEATFGDDDFAPPAFGTPYTFTVSQ